MCVHKVYINYKRCTWGLYKFYAVVQKKKSHFSKGFWSINLFKKLNIFHLVWAKQARKENVLTIFWIEKSLSWQEKQDFKKQKKLRFSKGVSLWFSSKTFYKKTGKEKVFGDVLDRMRACLDNESVDFKKSKKLYFLKGLYHGSSQKFESCSSFYFMQNRQGRCVCRYSR